MAAAATRRARAGQSERAAVRIHQQVLLRVATLMHALLDSGPTYNAHTAASTSACARRPAATHPEKLAAAALDGRQHAACGLAVLH